MLILYLLLQAVSPSPTLAPIVLDGVVAPVPVTVVVPVPAPTPQIIQVVPRWSKEEIGVLVAGGVTLLGALGTFFTMVIGALKKQGRVLHKVHLLTNSRLGSALKLLVRMTKKEADRTKDPDDIAAYQEALRELESAAAGALAVAELQSEDEDVR